jgi:predicted AlkP superfamily pyrophosphatase or phosphodiesterase
MLLRRIIVLLISLIAGPYSVFAAAAKPRLVVAIIIDQFRYDYLLWPAAVTV